MRLSMGRCSSPRQYAPACFDQMKRLDHAGGRDMRSSTQIRKISLGVKGDRLRLKVLYEFDLIILTLAL